MLFIFQLGHQIGKTNRPKNAYLNNCTTHIHFRICDKKIDLRLGCAKNLKKEIIILKNFTNFYDNSYHYFTLLNLQ